MEATRMQAADLFTKGVSQADIGRELGVSHQTVSDWHKLWKVGGKRALKRTGQPGRPRKVTDADLAKVERALQKGPKANGYPTDLWTLARIAEVIEKAGGHLVPDTCIDQVAWKHLAGKRGVTDSLKGAYYTQRRDMEFVLRSVGECVEAAIKGEAA